MTRTELALGEVAATEFVGFRRRRVTGIGAKDPGLVGLRGRGRRFACVLVRAQCSLSPSHFVTFKERLYRNCCVAKACLACRTRCRQITSSWMSVSRNYATVWLKEICS